MRAKHTMLVLTCCGWLTGCGIVTTATHNILTEVRQHEEDDAERKRERELADQTWAQWQSCHPEHADSEAFSEGFRAGFADFLYAGGTGEPPTLPPQKYWKIGYESPEGHQAMEEWFAGFRTGAAEARRSGARQWIVLPSSTGAAPAVTIAPPVLGPPASPAPVEHALPQRQPLPPGPPSVPNTAPLHQPRPVPSPSARRDARPNLQALPPEPPGPARVTMLCPKPRAQIVRVSAVDPRNDRIIPRGSVVGVQARPMTSGNCADTAAMRVSPMPASARTLEAQPDARDGMVIPAHATER